MFDTCGDQAASERPTDGVGTATKTVGFPIHEHVCGIWRIKDMSKKKEPETGGREGHMTFPHS